MTNVLEKQHCMRFVRYVNIYASFQRMFIYTSIICLKTDDSHSRVYAKLYKKKARIL